MKHCFTLKCCNHHIAIADLSTDFYSGTPSQLYLSRINVPGDHIGQGFGRTLMHQVLDAADDEAITLALELNPTYGLSFDQLEAWYRRLGFEYDDNMISVMVRNPLHLFPIITNTLSPYYS